MATEAKARGKEAEGIVLSGLTPIRSDRILAKAREARFLRANEERIAYYSDRLSEGDRDAVRSFLEELRKNGENVPDFDKNRLWLRRLKGKS